MRAQHLHGRERSSQRGTHAAEEADHPAEEDEILWQRLDWIAREGSSTLTLPDNEAIQVMAVTVANSGDGEFRAAQPLYDTLAGNTDVTEFPAVEYIPLPPKEDQ